MPRVAKRVCTAFALLALPPMILAQATVIDKGSVEQRLGRVERLLDTRSLVELLNRVERLQLEVRDLRGEVELQSHTIRQLKNMQKELYVDIDDRLSRVETRTPGAATAVAGPPVSGVAPVAGAGQTPPLGGTAPEPAAAAPPPTVEPVAPVQPEQPPVDPVAEQNAYQQAFNLLKQGRYDEATGAFKDFLKTYPGGNYAANAQYWLGETYYVTRRFQPALGEFEKLLGQYPGSRKTTHAMLKIGYIRDELGQTEGARKVLGDLVTQYPNTTAAKLARERLQKLKAQ